MVVLVHLVRMPDCESGEQGSNPEITQNARVALLRMAHLGGLDPLALEVQVLSRVLNFSIV